MGDFSMSAALEQASASRELQRAQQQNVEQANSSVQQQGLQTQKSKDTLQKAKLDSPYAQVDLKKALK